MRPLPSVSFSTVQAHHGNHFLYPNGRVLLLAYNLELVISPLIPGIEEVVRKPVVKYDEAIHTGQQLHIIMHSILS